MEGTEKDAFNEIVQHVEKLAKVYKDYEIEEVKGPFELILSEVAYRLSDVPIKPEDAAYVAFAVALARVYGLARLYIPLPEDVLVEAMKRVGFEPIRDKCERVIVEMVLKSDFDSASNVLSKNNVSMIIAITPEGLLAFKR